MQKYRLIYVADVAFSCLANQSVFHTREKFRIIWVEILKKKHKMGRSAFRVGAVSVVRSSSKPRIFWIKKLSQVLP